MDEPSSARGARPTTSRKAWCPRDRSAHACSRASSQAPPAKTRETLFRRMLTPEDWASPAALLAAAGQQVPDAAAGRRNQHHRHQCRTTRLPQGAQPVLGLGLLGTGGARRAAQAHGQRRPRAHAQRCRRLRARRHARGKVSPRAPRTPSRGAEQSRRDSRTGDDAAGASSSPSSNVSPPHRRHHRRRAVRGIHRAAEGGRRPRDARARRRGAGAQGPPDPGGALRRRARRGRGVGLQALGERPPLLHPQGHRSAARLRDVRARGQPPQVPPRRRPARALPGQADHLRGPRPLSAAGRRHRAGGRGRARPGLRGAQTEAARRGPLRQPAASAPCPSCRGGSAWSPRARGP